MRRFAPLVLVLLFACDRRHPVEIYPGDVVANFMKSCTTRSSQRVCDCAIDSLQAHFTLEQFRGFEARLAKNDVPREMLDALAECRD